MVDLLLHVQSAVKKLAEIGTGAFGEVWLGHNSTFGKVAVKTIKVWYFLLCWASMVPVSSCSPNWGGLCHIRMPDELSAAATHLPGPGQHSAWLAMDLAIAQDFAVHQ